MENLETMTPSMLACVGVLVMMMTMILTIYQFYDTLVLVNETFLVDWGH